MVEANAEDVGDNFADEARAIHDGDAPERSIYGQAKPEEAKQLKAKLTIASLETSLRLYKLDNGAYPTTEQGLSALLTAPDTGNVSNSFREGGYIEKGKIPKDPWGSEFIYLSPGINGEYDIISYGSDGVPGGEGKDKDINSWEID